MNEQIETTPVIFIISDGSEWLKSGDRLNPSRMRFDTMLNNPSICVKHRL